MQALNPYLTIGAQLGRILVRHGLSDGRAARDRVIAMLERVGLPDAPRQVRAFPHELSGGMRQRAIIASALLCEPELLIADEPTTALDVTVQAQVLDLLDELREDTALLLITHDLGVVAGRCERMVVLEKGRVVEQGATGEVFAAPTHAHTKALLQAAPRADAGDAPASEAGATVLTIAGAEVRYPLDGRQRLHAVRGVDLEVGTRETVAVVGESGSGKSSLVRSALGLVPATAGRVVLSGEVLPPDVNDRSLATRRGMQLVFQDPAGSLNPQMRVAAIVAEPIVVHEPGTDAVVRRERVARMLARTGLGEEFLDRFPHELSGGQAQRVAIARALILEPAVLVRDEAVAALDGTVREHILELLRRQQAERPFAIIFNTHHMAVARSVSHRVAVMYLGMIVERASTADLFSAPRHPYTRALLEAIPIADPDNPGGRASVTGEVPSPLSPPSGCAFHPRCPHARRRCASDAPELRRVGGSLVRCHFAEDL
jgi:oligopeptide/dipeptide ABC transporter ATP-binding protein